jgi:hypothetical protein
MRISPARSAALRPAPASPDRLAVRRSGELAAWLAALVVAAQLVLFPLVAITVAALILTGRLSRWRPHWLLVPGLGGLCWLAGYWRAGASWRRGLPGQLALLLHPGDLTAAVTRTSQWLPVYVIAATGEAAIVLWLGWRRSQPAWRPGLVAAQRRRASVRALAIGRTVTCDGCALGVEVPSGRLAAVSWAAAERGVLLAGHDQQLLVSPALAAVCAAIRRRKTVLLLDLGGTVGAASSQLVALAANLGVPASQVALPASGSVAAGLEAVIGRAIRRREVIAIRTLPGAGVLPGSDAQSAGGAQAAVAALTSVLASLRDLALRGDCLVWIAGCEAADDGTVRSLLALGPATGTAVLLSTVNAEARPFPAVGQLIVADAVPGRFAVHRAAGGAPKVIQTVASELTTVASSRSPQR